MNPIPAGCTHQGRDTPRRSCIDVAEINAQCDAPREPMTRADQLWAVALSLGSVGCVMGLAWLVVR